MAALKNRESSSDKSGATPSQAPTHERADLLGQMAGEYRIMRKLGVGGFGAVYEAEHPLLKRRAAVKVLHSHPALDSVGVQRFIEEARSASQIRHRNIVDIFSFGTLPNGQYFYVMDLIEGAPLDRYLREHGRLAPEQVLPLLKPIASALDALHAAAIVHRDVKPGNIYLAWESSGEVVPKLLDFGLVKLLGSDATVNSVSGVPMGTPHYMAPEQCRGEKVDARADTYALGVLCHELLTGTRPFTGDSATAVLVAHVLQTAPRMSEVNPAVSPELDEPVLQMLAKDPAARPSSALEAVRAIELAALDAGLTIVEGPLWLPRLPETAPETAPPPEPHSFATDATVERSGLRSGPQRSTRSTYVAFAFGALGLLLLLVWFGARRAPAESSTQPPSAAEVQPLPSQPLASPQSPSPPPPAAEDPGAIELTLRGAPAGASVQLGDRKLGDASQPISLPFGREPLRLRVSAPGYAPLLVDVTPDRARELSVTLDKAEKLNRPVPPKRSGVPRDFEDPF